jgi:hypothetical protein
LSSEVPLQSLSVVDVQLRVPGPTEPLHVAQLLAVLSVLIAQV